MVKRANRSYTTEFKNEAVALVTEQGYSAPKGIRRSLMDATIIEAPSSTKNKTGVRDPKMHQTKKGNQ